LKYKAELWICYCDTQTTKPEKLKSESSNKLRVIGRKRKTKVKLEAKTYENFRYSVKNRIKISDIV